MRPLAALAVTVAAILAPTGCGGGGTGKPSRRVPTPAARNVDPRPSEKIGDVIDRVRGAVTAGSCGPVKGLLHSSYPTLSPTACAAVEAEIDGFDKPKGKAYGTGAVIGYETAGGGRRLMVLVLDGDRTYHVDYIADSSAPSVSARRPPAADAAVSQAVRSMQTGDCDAFLRYVDRSLGLGVGSDAVVCRRVSDVPFRRELVANRAARPVALGGNGAVAFYKLRTAPDRYYTLVMAHRPGAPVQTGWGLVNALPAG